MDDITVFQNSLTTGMISCYPIGKLCARHLYLSMHLDHGEKNRGFFFILKTCDSSKHGGKFLKCFRYSILDA